MSRRMPCPACKRTRWIPLAFRPYCTRGCKADAAEKMVRCRVCSELHWPGSTTVMYRSLDKTWQCRDEHGCRQRALARTPPAALAAMYRALDAAWADLEANGWSI